MKTFACLGWSILFTGLLAASARADEAPWQMTVQTDKPGAKINPSFYGLMTEEINHAYDGGLYAELIQNRAFKDNAHDPVHWLLVQDGGGAGTMSIDTTTPLNPALPNSLKLEVASGGKRVGVANEGFCHYSRKSGGRDVQGPGGLPVKPDTTYKVVFYARAAGGIGPVKVDLESAGGNTVYALGTVNGVGGEWRRFSLELKTGANVTPSLDNHFVISTAGTGTLWLGYVSLFPPTYKDRPNGNRIDLSEILAAMHPAFLRFPGGNYVDPGHYLWKNTVGPVEQRPGNPGAWDYRTSEGLGLLEFFLWCEDLGMEPLLAVSDGRSWLPADGDVAPLVQDALDEIEYATGDPSTRWGARRAADGHPAPFRLRYVEIGNEDMLDRSAAYEARFPKFYDAIKAKYPSLKLIATRRDMHVRTPDLIDDHIYATVPTMARAGAKYDQYPRTAPKVFVGEWATQDGRPTPTLRGALGDAAYLTGLERNADVIEMACYAPLFTSVLPNGRQWPTNLIGFDALHSFGSPSYYVQCLFNANKGDVVLPVSVSPTGAPAADDDDRPHGGVGVGTRDTQAEFKDARVTGGAATLLQTGPSTTAAEWPAPVGNWSVQDGVFAQTGGQQLARALSSTGKDWTDYTYTVKARKTGGKEGFLVFFHVADEHNFVFWNLGGWANSRSGLEQTIDGAKEEIGQPEEVTVETGRWYDIRIDVKGRDIACYLDGKLITQATEPAGPRKVPVYVSATRDDATHDVILKVANLNAGPQRLKIDLAGMPKVSPQATLQTITGDPNAMNSVEEPTRIAPTRETIQIPAATFEHEFPANSVSVLRVKP